MIKKNINPSITFEVGKNMLDSITNHLISVTSATSGFYHSHLVITHQLNKVFFQYFRKGNIPETETLTLSFEQRLSIWHDKGSQRKLYVSSSSIEIQQIFIFQLFLFYQISILQTKHIQVVIAKP
ncbi:MAG: hypothetical protein HC932_00455 [Thermales bacterium]|nr:hypothetical protein [Thermales bacterium]